MSGPIRRRRALVLLATSLVLALTGCSLGAPDETESGESPNLPTPSASPTAPGGSAEDDGVGVQVLAKNLQVPWGVAFLPDGNAVVTERDTRRILRVTPGGRVTPIQTINDAYSGGEGGL